MADINPLQAVVDELKGKLTGAETDRDKAKAEIETVKKQGEKVLDENSTLSRTVDDLKKNVSNLIKGRPGAGDPPADPPPPAGEKPKESVGAMLNRWMDSAWHFPQKPPEKSDS